MKFYIDLVSSARFLNKIVKIVNNCSKTELAGRVGFDGGVKFFLEFFF